MLLAELAAEDDEFDEAETEGEVELFEEAELTEGVDEAVFEVVDEESEVVADEDEVVEGVDEEAEAAEVVERVEAGELVAAVDVFVEVLAATGLFAGAGEGGTESAAGVTLGEVVGSTVAFRGAAAVKNWIVGFSAAV